MPFFRCSGFEIRSIGKFCNEKGGLVWACSKMNVEKDTETLDSVFSP